MGVLKKDNNRSFLLGASIGAAAFFLIYGVGFLNPFSDVFILNGYLEKDITQHYAGWLLYKNSPWQFPLGVGQNIAYPYGSSVAFTDSIPLFAVLFKALRFLLPQSFQYFGLFTFISFVLQGGFAALLCRLFCNKLSFYISGAVLFVFFPVFVERAARHTALTAQWLILAALYYYFKNSGKGLKKYTPFIILNLLAVSIHPYFMPFTFAIMLAFTVRDALQTKKILKPFSALVFSLVGTMALAYILGIFYTGGGTTSGYGYFSMNLNAYINPRSLRFDNWSLIMPQRAQGAGQYDGFNYLGLGVLLGLIAGIVWLVKNRKTAVLFAKNNFTLLLVTFILLLFAISTNVMWGGLQLLHIPLPPALETLFSIFRASGRYGWLLGYLLALFALISVYSLFKDKYAKYAVFALLAIQLVDISGVLLQKQAYFYGSEKQSSQKIEYTLTAPLWNECEFEYYFSAENGAPSVAVDIAALAAKKGKSVNIQFSAREAAALNNAFMQSLNADILNGNIKPATLYFLNNPTHYADIQKSGRAFLFSADGRFMLTSSQNKERLVANGALEITPDTLFAESYNEMPYANGVYNELNVIMVYPPKDMFNSILNAKEISTGKITAKVDKVTQEGEMLYIFLQSDIKADAFAYPNAFWIEEP